MKMQEQAFSRSRPSGASGPGVTNDKKCRISNSLIFDTAGCPTYHPRPMLTSALPKQADLRRLAAGSASVAGQVALADLARLEGVLSNSSGVVDVSFQFGVDEEGYRSLTGNISAVLHVECQRCLETVRIEVEAPVSLALVWAEKQIPSLPSRYEGLVVGVDPVDLHELVEEELLLSLPLVPAHPPGQCPSRLAGSDENVEGPSRGNPFEMLRGGVDG